MARSSLPAFTASMALRSHSSACVLFSSSCRSSFFSSAMDMATCFFASMSCSFMSMISWFSIFSGSSALLMRALILDFRTVLILSRIPMCGSSCHFFAR